MLKCYRQQVYTADAGLRLEKSKFLPDINLGVYSQSLHGLGADDSYYPLSRRFTAAQAGMGIPLVFGSQRARVNSAEARIAIAQNELDWKCWEMTNELRSALLQLESNRLVLDYFESNQLRGADRIQQVANEQFAAGEIDFLEWTLLNNQAIQIQTSYLDALKRYNDNAIQINYLTTK